MFIQDATVLYVGQRRIRDFLLLPEIIQKITMRESPKNDENAVY
jgi:hypothetical protein